MSYFEMSQSNILLDSINKFYMISENAECLENILLEKRGNVSLRNLEWFITNYAKENQLSYTTIDGKSFSVHCAYKSSLDGYSKKLFDAFCRTEKFIYTIPCTDKEVTTTVAQLNFIRWCIKNGILDYIQANKNILHCKMVKNPPSKLSVTKPK
jgi:hypothetical protein